MTLNELHQCIALLDVAQYLGFPHFWGKLYLHPQTDKSSDALTVEHKMTARQAAERNRREGVGLGGRIEWKRGDTTAEFDSLAELYKAAIVLVKQHDPNIKWLMHGNRASYPPYNVLIGPQPAKTQLTKLWQEAEALEWFNYRKNEARMEAIEKEWFEIFEGAEVEAK